MRQPETFSYVAMLRDYRPVASFDGHEFGNGSAGDLPMLPPRHQNVAQSIFDQSQDMIVNHMYEQGAADGWWPCPYGCANGGNVGLSEETILRNTLGLKNVTNSLLELRSAGGATRPDEGARPTTGGARPTRRCGRSTSSSTTTAPAWPPSSWPAWRPSASRSPTPAG